MPLPRMYTDLAPWWPLLSAPADYEEEAGIYADAIERRARGEVRAVLELGSGGGNNASHLTGRYAMTLVDLSEDMLAVSRTLNPTAEHLVGDMRTVRLERTFDAVLIQDAIMYMTTEDDLAAAIETAAVHLRPGGTAIFVPDHTTETFEPGTHAGGHDGDDGRAMRYLEWDQGPAPGETVATVTYVYVLSERGEITVEHEQHRVGVFPRANWIRLIEAAGLRAHAEPYPHSEFVRPQEFFSGVKP